MVEIGERMTRSDSLPSFAKPPVNEVVLGVQFARPERYQLIYSRDVYDLFKDRYPTIQEQVALPPHFETFGATTTGNAFSFQLAGPAAHPRFWFIDTTGHELVQFQPDKLYHNWRQLNNQDADYPRYSALRSSFSRELHELDTLFRSSSAAPLNINQVEVSYYNRIYGQQPDVSPRPDEWLKFVDFGDRSPEAFNGTYREVIRGSTGQPIARFFAEINSSVDELGHKMILFTLTARGAPTESSIDAALEFLDFQSDFIVRTFAEITTEEAHKLWQRTR